MRTFIGRVGLPITLTLSLVMALPVAAQDAFLGTIYQTTNIRSGPSTQYDIVGQLSAGDEVVVVGRNTDSMWLQINVVPDLAGWLPTFSIVTDVDLNALEVIDERDETAPSGEDAPQVMVESYGRVNVRSGPGIDYGIVGQLDVGEQVEATARNNRAGDWLMIVLSEDTEGWVAFFTISALGDVTTLPVLTLDATGESLIAPNSLAQTQFNVRLHADPSLDALVVAVIPFSNVVTPLGKSADGSWMLVGYQNVSGWGAARLFSMDKAAFEALPIQQ